MFVTRIGLLTGRAGYLQEAPLVLFRLQKGPVMAKRNTKSGFSKRQREFRAMARELEATAGAFTGGKGRREKARFARKVARDMMGPAVRVGPSPEYEVVFPKGARA